jgi:tetratricopeptide (TPR) repeat protein
MALLMGAPGAVADAGPPFEPASDADILATVPAGGAHASLALRSAAASRRDVALPLAQFYIAQTRSSGDLRFLGYAQALLIRWTRPPAPDPQALVLMATVLQSRHEFGAALDELDLALRAHPNDPQAWLTRATVLRVLGRYPEAQLACERVANAGAEEIGALCLESIRALTGTLQSAYEQTRAVSPQALTNTTRAWRYSQLGEMAAALGDDAAAAHWFRECLELTPDDMYTRAADADVLLRQKRPADVLQLLSGYQSIEPMLLRLAIAQRSLGSPDLARSRAALEEAFALEERRKEAVHRREQARFLLDVLDQPDAALRVALINWQVQREPDDVLVLIRAAHEAGRAAAAAEAVAFVHAHHLEDARLAPYLSGLQ